ncbi:gibberellin 2-beta-dioxygenase 1-like [Zingiber officinale]|uniref:gibberellin 2-beta-dioxygenase 1-like n=1 Tax=Zingiber officinale TaxID=94328 RepID=UPI001C4D54B6|nr:gibberellin 2-beta-dioxygenase 1-like [Zingiber officinale]
MLKSPPPTRVLTMAGLKENSFFPGVPVITLSDPDAETLLVRACEDLGFFRVTNHGIPMELIARLEEEIMQFFARPAAEKELAGKANPFGYGSKSIGNNGDVGWVEYLLIEITSKSLSMDFLMKPSASSLRSALNDYTLEMRKLACQILEMMAHGLGIEPRDAFSKLVMDEESDSMLRVNYYPPCPMIQEQNRFMTGFGEHTDPQLISVLRSNETAGLEISLRDGSWVPVLPNPESFFINVGDSLQVLTNGRFRSVRHRVLTKGLKSRVSMIYFGGPPPGERLAPLPLLIAEGEQSQYREFTWHEYKSCAYKTVLVDSRLDQFQKRDCIAERSDDALDFFAKRL